MDINQLTKELARASFGEASVDVGDFILTFTVDTDDISPMEHINDCEAYGKVEWGRRNRDTGRHERPEGFTGAACKVYSDGRDYIWWEPYREGSKVYNSTEDRLVVEQLLRDGFFYVRLGVQERCSIVGSDGRVIGIRYEEVDCHGCGGIDDDSPEVLEEFLTDFLYEAGIDQEWLDKHSEKE